MHFTSKDLYKLLRISRTATQQEIKQSYLQIAMTLHPDRHIPGSSSSSSSSSERGANAADNDTNHDKMISSRKTEEFKKVSEAYGILRDRSLRMLYDKFLDSSDSGGGDSGASSRAAARNPFYRKVYSPAAPPGMKTFDRQRHYDMHYGDGMMNEAIERARKRAQAASTRTTASGMFSSHHHSSYQSPLGAGFTFDKHRPRHEQINPYSLKGKRQRPQSPSRNDQSAHAHNSHHNNDDETENFHILYEEAHFNANGGVSSTRFGGGGGFSGMERMRGGKEYVLERMKNRRKYRVRERGEPNLHNSYRQHHAPSDEISYNRRSGGNDKRVNNADEGFVRSVSTSGCAIM